LSTLAISSADAQFISAICTSPHCAKAAFDDARKIAARPACLMC